MATRALDPMEVLFTKTNICNCAAAAFFDIEDGHQLDLKALERAVHQTIQKHPILQSNYDLSASPIQFYPATDFSSVFITRDDEPWEEVLRQEINSDLGVGTEKPLFKVVFLKAESQLLIFFHHTVGDGATVYVFINDVMTAYVWETTGSEKRHCPLESLPSAMELCFPKGLSQEDEKAKGKLLQEIQDSRARWKPLIPLNFQKGETLENGAIFLEGTPERLEELKKRSRVEGTTVTGIMMAALQFVLAKKALEWQTAADDKEIRVYLHVPFNLRNRLDPPLGFQNAQCIISNRDFVAEVSSETDFWQLARNFQSEKTQYLESGGHRVSSTLPLLLAQSSAQNKGTDHRVFEMVLSNIGPYPFAQTYGPAHLNKVCVTGAQWVPIFGSGGVVLVTALDSMCYSVNYHVKNRRPTAQIFVEFTQLTEQAGQLPKRFSFRDFLTDK